MSGITEKIGAGSGLIKEVLTEKISIFDKYMDIIFNYLGTVWPRIVGAILILWIGFKIINILNSIINKYMVKAKLDPLIKTFSLSLVSIILKVLVFLSAAGMLGVQTNSFIALFTAAGVAIGMSLSGTLQNFAGGVIILAFKLYRIGDYIDIGGKKGTVKEIHIFHTIIITLDKKTIIVPNAKISDGTMTNFSTEQIRRIDIDVGVGYETDTKVARDVFSKIIENDDRILKGDDYKVNIFVNELGDSAVVMTLRFFVKSSDYLAVQWDVKEEVLIKCRENNINIPFPQRDVHVYNK